MKTLPFSIFLVFLFLSCSQKQNVNEYSFLYGKLKKDDYVQEYLLSVKKSASSLRSYTLSNEKISFLKVQDLNSKNTKQVQKRRIWGEIATYSSKDSQTHGDYFRTSIYYYLKAYKRYVIDQKVQKELFRKVIDDITFENYQIEKKQITTTKITK